MNKHSTNVGEKSAYNNEKKTSFNSPLQSAFKLQAHSFFCLFVAVKIYIARLGLVSILCQFGHQGWLGRIDFSFSFELAISELFLIMDSIFQCCITYCRLFLGVSNIIRDCRRETYCQLFLVQIASRKLDWLVPVNEDFCGSKMVSAVEENTNFFWRLNAFKNWCITRLFSKKK